MSNGTVWTSGSCAGSASSNFSTLQPDAPNTVVGTFTATGNTWDFSGATAFKFKVGAASTITNAGSSGQVPISNGDGTFTVADPFVSGPVAHDGAGAAVNPLPGGCFANAAAPADVSADVDIARAWCLRNGARVFNMAFGGTLVTAGSKTMANSFPIVFASDQTAIPVTMTSTTITGTVGVTQSTSPWVVSVPTWAGGTLGAMANYGTTPGAVLVPGVNAFITNIPHFIADSGSTTAVTGTVAVTQSTSPWVGNMTQWASTVLGTPTAFGTTPGAVVAGSVNASLFSGTTALGVPNTFGTTAPTGNALGVNAACFQGTTLCINDGTAGALGVGGHFADNGVAAATNRMPTLPCIYQTGLLNGTAATQGRNGAASCGSDGLLWVASLPALRPASYHASASFAGSSTTIAAHLIGHATNMVLVTKVMFSCTQTTAGNVTVTVNKTSAASSGGTAATMTAIPDDSVYSAASASAQSFTGTGPTVGTAVGQVDAYKLGCMATGTATPNDIYILNLRQKPIVLRAATQTLEIGVGAATTGGNYTTTFEWEETPIITE